jgi:FkbM family methyltransferase
MASPTLQSSARPRTARPLLVPLRQLFHRTVTRRRVIAAAPAEVRVPARSRDVRLEVEAWPTANFVVHNSPAGHFDYEPEESALFRELLEGVDTFFDVGAHIGYYGLLASGNDPRRRVIAFELLEDFADEVERHAENNGFDRLKVERAAVGRGGEWIAFQNFADAGRRVAVSLFGYCRAHGLAPQLIKLDIEGNEVAAIEGLRPLLDELRPTLQLAFHPPMIAEKGLEPLDALRPLWEAGYSIERVVPGRDGERYGLQAIECEADAPRDLCTLICRP